MKRVIITGAASGNGAATLATSRECGAEVIGPDLNGGDDIVACEVTSRESVDAALATAIESAPTRSSAFSPEGCSRTRSGRCAAAARRGRFKSTPMTSGYLARLSDQPEGASR